MKQWRTPKKGHSYAPASIESGDVGIWVTCDKNKEGLCTIELRDLFEEVRERPTRHLGYSIADEIRKLDVNTCN